MLRTTQSGMAQFRTHYIAIHKTSVSERQRCTLSTSLVQWVAHLCQRCTCFDRGRDVSNGIAQAYSSS